MSLAPLAVDFADSVMRHMRADFTVLENKHTVEEALAAVRASQPQGRIIYFYVVDADKRLQGVVPTRRLLLSPGSRRISEIMVPQVIAIPSSATVFDACEFFTLHRFLAFPVVDAERRLVGMVDVELYTSELTDLETQQRSDDLFQLIGVHLSSARQNAPVAAFRGRLPWLICNVAGGIVAAFITGMFEEQLQSVVALALFIPVVLALAESVSVQSVSLALQSLHGAPPTLRALVGRLRAELYTGALLGAATGVIVGLVALAWLGHLRLALCVLGGIAFGVTFAAVIGLAMPNVLRLFRRDPKVAAGPIALAIADMITLLVYFNLARLLLG
jgi:magnesium transporter